MPHVTTLADLALPAHRPSAPGTKTDHPMRVMTRRAAGIEGPPWGPDSAKEVATLFNSLAPEWHTRESGDRAAIVEDALRRGLDILRDATAGIPDVVLELGSGLGTYSDLLTQRFDIAIAAELSEKMQHLAHSTAAVQILADGSQVPLGDASLGAIVLINCFLFPAEVDRTLAPGGVLVWVNSSGESTPIHLSTQEVVSALPFEVIGFEARAGIGTWCALHRVG